MNIGKNLQNAAFYFPDRCAVVGLPDRDWGERVTAFIVPHKDQKLNAAELKSFLKNHLAGFKRPKEYIFVEELPKNNAGKLLKREIRKKFVE